MGFWGDTVWRELEPSAGVIVAETATTILRLCGCFLVYLFLRLMAASGFEGQWVHHLETLDYWATLAFIGVFLLNGIVGQLIAAVVRYLRKTEK